MTQIRYWSLGIGLCFLVSACGTAKIGETCKTAGATTDECEAGAACTNATAVNTCRKICTVQGDCAATEACNGVSGTNIKSCQPS